MPSEVSAKHALLDEELEFCKIYLAFGEKNASEAYRRSFYPSNRYTTDEDVLSSSGNKMKPMPRPGTVAKKAKALLSQDYIRAYLLEVKRPAGEHARNVLAEGVQFGRSDEARRSAQLVLDQEDKLGFDLAVDRWVQIMHRIGAEVVVPLPSSCQECGARLEASIPIGDMFPAQETQ